MTGDLTIYADNSKTIYHLEKKINMTEVLACARARYLSFPPNNYEGCTFEQILCTSSGESHLVIYDLSEKLENSVLNDMINNRNIE